MNSGQQQPGNVSGQQHNGQQSLNHIHPNNLHTCDLLSDPNGKKGRKKYKRFTFIFILCLSWCLYPINVNTAKPIGPKFCVGPHMTPGKVYG